MKTTLFLVLTFLLQTTNLLAQARTVTLMVSGTNSATLELDDFESCKFICAKNYPLLAVTKNSQTVNYNSDELTGRFANSINQGLSYYPPIAIQVAGPATLTVMNGSIYEPTMATFEIQPTSFPPDKTLILPPRTNQVYVGLESSTNLVNWSTATNGVYGSPDQARFFRIKMN